MNKLNMKLKNFKMELKRGSKVVITLNFDDQEELTKYVVKREKSLDAWL